MNLWQRMKSLFGGEAKPARSAGGLLASILQGGQMPRRGTKELLLAYARLPWVHSVVRRISNDVASVPPKLYLAKRGDTAKRLKMAAGPLRRQVFKDAIGAGEVEEVEAHPFIDLWQHWNPALGGHSSRAVVQAWLDLVGEGFAVSELNALGEPMELWPIPPHWIQDTPTVARPYFAASYQGWNRNLPEDAVTWLRLPNPENPYARGTGLGEALGDELDIDEAATKLLRNWFFNSAIPPAIVNLPDSEPAEAERFKTSLFQDHGGPSKANRVMVTNSPTMEVKLLSQTFKEQEIPELRAAAKEIVVQVFNVPPECMGILENSNRSTIDAADFLYAKGVLCPRLDFFSSSMQPVLDAFDDSLVLSYESPIAEDREFKRQVFLQAPAGTFTRDEYRELAGEEPMSEEEGDVKQNAPIFQYHMQYGVVTINEVRATLGLPPMEGGDVPPKPPDLFGGLGDPAALSMAAPPKLLAESASVPVVRAPLLVAKSVDIERVLRALRPERLTSEMLPVFEHEMERFGNAVLAGLGLQASFSMKNPLVRQHLETLAGKRITRINETTRDMVRAQLAEGVAAGEGVEAIARRITEVFDAADKVRARMIARTEVVGSSNFTNLAAYQQSGVVERKEWLSVRDGNTRTEHMELDGQVVGLSESFEVPGSGERAQYPGGFGEGRLDINCRCSVLPVVADPGGKAAAKSGFTWLQKMSEEEKVAAWKRYDSSILQWEKSTTGAMRRGFREQESDLLEELQR